MSFTVGVIGGWQLSGPLGEERQVRVAVQRLLAFLVLRGRMQQRALVAGSLWPENSDSRAGANLRSALWHARIEATGVVEGDGSTVWLCDDVSTDFDDATEVVRAVLLGQPVPSERLATLQGDVLPGWTDEWVEPARFLHRQLRLLAFERATRDATVTTTSPPCWGGQERSDR